MSHPSFLDHLQQDIRYGIRSMAKRPSFMLVVVLTLALGIGVNTAVFSLVNGILLQPLPFAEPDRLVSVWNHDVPAGPFVLLQERMKTVQVAAFSTDFSYNLSGEGEAVRLDGSEVSSNLFSLLGVGPKRGRVFRSGDELPGQDKIVIISNHLWETRFGSDPNIVGRWIVVDDVGRQVVGVMPSGFNFPSSSSELWLPAHIDISDKMALWGSFKYHLMGRLAPQAQLPAARAEFSTILPSVLKAFPFEMPSSFSSSAFIAPLQKVTVGDVRTTLLVLLGAVALTLLIACVNVANLLLARSATRQKEMAIRAALGASRRRIVVQLLTESLTLTFIGGAAGMGLSFAGLRILKAILPVSTPRLSDAGIDGHVLAFTAGLSLITGIAFGLAPSFMASKPDIEQTLRANSRSGGTSRSRRRFSAGLIVAEVALAVVIVGSAGLLIKSLWGLSRINVGFNTHHLLTARITPSDAYCRKEDHCRKFYLQVAERARTLPGVTDAAVTSKIPLDGFLAVPLVSEDDPTNKAPDGRWFFQTSPGYLRTMGIVLLQGRDFTDADEEGRSKVVLVSKSLADVLWSGRDPIGKHVKISSQPEWSTVVGIVSDVQTYKVAGADMSAIMSSMHGTVYFPQAQLPAKAGMDLVVRAEGDVSSLTRSIRDLVAAINPSTPVSNIRTMDEIVSDSVAAPRSTMWLFVFFACLALVLAVIGVYSVLSYFVTQRTQEIGVRMAVGANKWHVMKMLLRQGMSLTLAGVGFGLAGAILFARLMASLLYGVQVTDPLTFTVVSLVVIAASAIATFVPSRRATRTSPTIALNNTD
ncbi:MAG TPA: ABC transporter permease [Candidatus Angelobacter sp.]|nr:ABC transporter permease [Candidatus Angelobacter sp.]